MFAQIFSRKRRLGKFLVEVLAVAAMVMTVSALPSLATNNSGVLYSPDLAVHPNGTVGYPRAVVLEHGESDSQTVLSVAARANESERGSLPIFRSLDGGNSWREVSEVFSNTDGWDIEAPTLYEVPYSSGSLAPGDLLLAGTAWKVGDYTAQKIEVFLSKDEGRTWSYLSSCTETEGLPNIWGHGIWEPVFLMNSNGDLGCYISDERPENSVTNNQFIGHYISQDGGKTWSHDIVKDVAFPEDQYARPGMQSFTQLPDGSFVMSYEMCRDATDPDHACETYIKRSVDGFDWNPADGPGEIVRTADQRELLHTPYIAWVDDGTENGVLLLSGKRVVAGPTGNKDVLEESGEVLFANRSLGYGEWVEVPAPVKVSPTGAYAPGVPSCPGYSSPIIPIPGGDRFLYLTSTWLGVRNQCQVEFGFGEIPTFMGRIIGPGNKCLDVDSNRAVDGKPVQLWDCNIASGQRWSYMGDNTLRAFGKCLDVTHGAIDNHSPVQLWECNDSGAQEWIHRDNGSFYNPQSGRCLDAPRGQTENGTALQIYDCNGLWPQVWRAE